MIKKGYWLGNVRKKGFLFTTETTPDVSTDLSGS